MEGAECDAFLARISDGACLRLSLEKAGAAARRTARWRAPVGSVNMLPRDLPGRLQMTFKRAYLRWEGGPRLVTWGAGGTHPHVLPFVDSLIIFD